MDNAIWLVGQASGAGARPGSDLARAANRAGLQWAVILVGVVVLIGVFLLVARMKSEK